MTSMLTKKQHRLLMFINDRLEATGISPSFEEMKDALGLKSKSGIHRLIGALEERGFLRRLPHRARALEVLKLPPGSEALDAAPTKRRGNVVTADFGRRTAERKSDQPLSGEEGVEIPLHGRIAAGTPIEALQNTDSSITLPASMIGGGTHFALEVSGDSMVDLGILDGDTAIIRQAETANDGDIVVALVDNEEATLKTLSRRGEQVVLKPANSEFSTQILPAHRVRIQGKLVGLLRRY